MHEAADRRELEEDSEGVGPRRIELHYQTIIDVANRSAGRRGPGSLAPPGTRPLVPEQFIALRRERPDRSARRVDFAEGLRRCREMAIASQGGGQSSPVQFKQSDLLDTSEQLGETAATERLILKSPRPFSSRRTKKPTALQGSKAKGYPLFPTTLGLIFFHAILADAAV